jgi:hypothetical protein
MDYESLWVKAHGRARNRRVGTLSASITVVAAVLAAGTWLRTDGRSSTVGDGSHAGPSAHVTTALAPPGPTGPVRGGAGSCVEPYSPAAVGDRAFAFDGTVTAIGPGNTDRPGKGALHDAAVSFSVNEWFDGGRAPNVTVDLPPPIVFSHSEAPGWSYEVGARLLVSGEPRWGGAPLNDAVGWGCGFTRYYDPATAASWRQSATALSSSEYAGAVSAAKQVQRTVTGTFIGATAFVVPEAGICPVHVRLVWDKDANFVHGGVPGHLPPDGPRKALLLTVNPLTGDVCGTSAKYRDVGPAAGETLLYGRWPG